MKTATIHIGSGEPCPRCYELYLEGYLCWETVMPLDGRPAIDPLAMDGSGKCCEDCAAADHLLGQSCAPDWRSARRATANCRQEQIRLPGAPLGLVQAGFMRPNKDGDLELHHEWLEATIGDDLE